MRLGVNVWAVALAALWVGMIGLSTVREHLPGSYWFEPGDLAIEDAVQGTCPVIHYARAIHRPFHGRWLATLQRQLPSGGFSMGEIFTGEADYRPDTALPPHLTLDWWFWVPPEACDWPPGIYRVTTQWEVQPGGPTRFVRSTSNPFRIRPADPNVVTP